MEVLHQRYFVDVNCQDIQGRTVLHLVSAKGNWTMAEILINHGADIEIEDCDGNTPLHVAILCKQWAFAKNMLLLPLRNNFVIECTVQKDQISLRKNPSALNELTQIRRNNSIAAVMYQDHHIQYASENINFCLLDFCEIRNKRLRKNCNTISLSKQCKEQDNCTFVTSEKHPVEWTTKLELIANYVGRQNLLSWGSVKRE